MTDERCLSDPYFWEMMPWDEALMLEFSDRKFRRYIPHIHTSHSIH